jgi:transposase
VAVRGLGCPVRIALTAGQKGDVPQAEALLAELPAEVVMTDAAYDGDAIREAIVCEARPDRVPQQSLAAQKYPINEHLYAMRHLIERCGSKLKQFRRVANWYEKTARNFLAVLTTAAIVRWIR